MAYTRCVWIYIYCDSSSFKVTQKIPKHFTCVGFPFSLYFVVLSQKALSHKSQPSVLSWQVGNDFWFLSLLLFAFLSLNYRTAPTVPVRVKQLRAMLRGCTHRYLMIPVLYFNSGWGLSWLSRGASLCWDELTCYPGAAVEVRERERGYVLLAGLIQSAGCAVPSCYV